MADFEIITQLSDLESLASDLMSERVIAVDTEADSFYHYFDKTCLIQIATKRDVWLVDPLALGGPAELAPLGPVLSSPDVRVIFHAAEYDIFVLKRDCGFAFNNLFDTMVSAQLLGYPAIGLAALVEHHFGVKVPKDEQRSDWSRRPLSDKQLSYAAGDVHYLIQLAEKLERELKKAGRLSWAEEEFQALTGREWPEKNFDELGYLRIKGARKLDLKSLAVLHKLFLLRDARAREIDRPPFKVLGNRTLLEICQTQPTTIEKLSEIKGVTDLIIRRMGKELISTVKEARQNAHGPIPKLEGNGRKRMDRRTERRVAELKNWRTPRAEALAIDPGVLCPNAALEAIAWVNPERGSDLEGTPDLKPWFVREFGDEVARVLHEDESATMTTAPKRDKTEKPPKSAKAEASEEPKGTAKSTRSASRSSAKDAASSSSRKRRRG